MKAERQPCGSARALTRRLDSEADRLALYAALTGRGARRDTMLLETLAGASLLLERAALRIECRGQQVTVTAVSANGRTLLGSLAERFGTSERDSDRLAIGFERATGDDAEARLLAASPFDVLRALSTGLRNDSPEEPFTVALLGIVAFDHVELFEELPGATGDPSGVPDFLFWLAESLVVFEPGLAPRIVCTGFNGEGEGAAAGRMAEIAARAASVAPLAVPALGAPPQGEPDLSDEQFGALVLDMKEHVLAGDVYQVVPSRGFATACADPLAAFAAARSLDRSPYMFFVAAEGFTLFGTSPETSVRVRRAEGELEVEIKPIAGTRPRGADADEDDRFEAELRLDTKEIAEHMMLVDLARNDVARVSRAGSRRVNRLMTVERYARVMHLVSSVTGLLRGGYDALHALVAGLNVGTLSGAPKLRATQLIRAAEGRRRGAYGGAIGWLSGEGTLDTGVIIRSALVRDGMAEVRAGAGVVYDSDPAAEADETRRKASAILSAIAASEAAR
ncbi:anthranilate synthase component 1 [Sphingomonas ginkgonis]|uniref:anthranilate synthase component 1 n=1 Tax=Sphingomonas ginkgonis TaxID=2315330 RepID=UPI001639E635|nr:anthranilate synthase component 1 [Sphingomonas ginkgonis]